MQINCEGTYSSQAVRPYICNQLPFLKWVVNLIPGIYKNQIFSYYKFRSSMSSKVQYKFEINYLSHKSLPRQRDSSGMLYIMVVNWLIVYIWM